MSTTASQGPGTAGRRWTGWSQMPDAGQWTQSSSGLDRLGRSLRHLVTLLDELHALGVGFVSLGEGIDLGTPAGRLQLHILAALAEFEKSRIAERVLAGLERARRQGRRLGRPLTRISEADLQRTADLSTREAARVIGVSPTVLYRVRTAAELG